jgi:hypothetical protein
MSGALKGPGAGSSPSQTEWEDEQENGAEVSPLVVEAVGKALHAHFQAIAEMPLPDRLLVLLAELEARERRQDN